MSFVFRIFIALAVVPVAISCRKNNNSGSSLKLDNSALYRKAQAGELGACSVKIESVQCWSNNYNSDTRENMATVFLTDKGLYYPTMEAKIQTTSWNCDDVRRTPDIAKSELRNALTEGFCR